MPFSRQPPVTDTKRQLTDEVLITRQCSFSVHRYRLAVLVSIDVARTWVVVIGLIVFGVVFAMNSALPRF